MQTVQAQIESTLFAIPLSVFREELHKKQNLGQNHGIKCSKFKTFTISEDYL